MNDSRLRSEALLKFKGYRCKDNRFISALFANGNIIGNSQTAKQMKDLRFKYEITLERLKYTKAEEGLPTSEKKNFDFRLPTADFRKKKTSDFRLPTSDLKI